MTKTPWLVLLLAAVGCGRPTPGSPAAPEVVETQIKLDMPAVPEFTEPTSHGDGTHSVAELRRDMRRPQKKFLDQTVTVKGYVVWVYDCATALGPEVAKDNPEKCDRPYFYLGDTADASLDKAIWVVEVPRAPRPDEEKFLPKEELEKWPPVPTIELGKRYNVEGTWATKSPKGFMNTDGLLVYVNMTPVT